MDLRARLNRRVLDEIGPSGIRGITELARTIPGAINLSIGQPDFPVPGGIKQAAVDAILNDRNGYSANQGLDQLRIAVADHLLCDVGWQIAGPGQPPNNANLLITGGTSGAILLACLAMLDLGDEIIIPDPYFVIYPPIAAICGARAVRCHTYPDFRMTAERVAPLITPRTKMVLCNSPGNPSGTVASGKDCADLLALCRAKDLLLACDEIYDDFTYSESRSERTADGSRLACPSPARIAGAEENVLLIRGFGKTYGITGWRLGFAAGPTFLIEQMLKLQQHTFVCAPTPLQWGAIEALRTDMSAVIAHYEQRRDRVFDRLSRVTDIERPGGAYYAFPKVPPRLNMSASQFALKLIDEKVLVVPGTVFSGPEHDTHFRISFATPDDTLDRGLQIITRLMS